MKLFSYGSIVLCVSLLSSSLNALTLKDSVIEVLNTNPIVKERLRNYRATQQDLNIAESEYLPEIDLSTAASWQKSGNINSDIDNNEFHFYESSLKLTQNIFDGFKTTYQVDYEEARILAAAYNYLEKANDIAFEMVGVYLNVLKNYELLRNAKENVRMNERLLEDIKELYQAKLVTKTDLIKIQASLAMAETNFVTLINNTKDAEYSFSRVLGRKPNIEDLVFPELNVYMPESIQRATIFAIKNNPSLLVSQYNIEGAQALYKRDKHSYYPKLDFELEQKYDMAHEDNNGFESDDDRFIAKLQLKWNLYNGGADSALVQKKISKISQEVEIKRDLKRQVIEGLELSYSTYEVVTKQIKKLNHHDQYISEILESLLEEYKLGKKSRRTVLDILSANSDLINAKSRMIGSKYDQLFAQYRILDAMGLMVTVVAGDEKEYRNRVNLDVKEASEVLDVLPISLDEDNDKIVDDLDICDNSKGDKIMPYGCVKAKDNNLSKL